MSWPLGRVSDIADVISGFAFKSEWFGTGDAKVIRIGDLKNGRIDLSGAKTFDNNANEVREQFRIRSGDILMALSGATVGKIAVADSEAEGTYLNQRVAVVRGRCSENSEYLKFVFSGSPLQKLLINAGGAAQPNLSTKDLAGMEIPLPPLTEQKRIAAILDKANAIHRKRKQAIQLSDEFLRAVFLNMFGDPVANPKGWEVRPLKKLSEKISSGSTPKGGSKVYVDKGIVFFRSQNVWRNDIRLDDVAFIDKKTHQSLKKSSLKHKDILMTKTGRFNTENSSLGRAALFLGKDDSGNVNGHVYLIRLKEGIFHEFVLYILTSIEYREHIRSVCVGGIDKRQLNKEHIEDFPIICPPHDLQIEFIQKLSAIQKIQSGADAGSKEARSLFNALSQKAFLGEL